MELKREKLDELRSLVNAALPKMAWLHDGGVVSDEDGWLVAECAEASDAAFIAAFDPPTALALLDALEAAQEDTRRLDKLDGTDQYVSNDQGSLSEPVWNLSLVANEVITFASIRDLVDALPALQTEPVTPAGSEEK